LATILITTDIAVGLSTSIQQAERLKTLRFAAGCDPTVTVSRRPSHIGDETETSQIPRAQLVKIIRPRVRGKILELTLIN